MHRLWIGAWVGVLLGVPVCAQDDRPQKPAAGAPAPKTPGEKLRALVEEQSQAVNAYMEAVRRARTDAERRELFDEKCPRFDLFAERFLAIADEAPKDPVAVDALIWAATDLGWPNGPVGKKVFERLFPDHITSDRMWLYCSRFIYAGPESEMTLRAILEKNPHRDVKGHACLALAQTLELFPLGEAAREKEAEALFGRVVEEFGGVKCLWDTSRDGPADVTRGVTLAAVAREELNKIRLVGVGKPAPRIEGEDIEGKPMKLSDFKGRVVVLDFGMDRDGSCRAMYPYERSLVKRLEGKPFVLLGINGDTDREAIRKARKENEVTWRSWWDGGDTRGLIFTAWSVYWRPTLVILDHEGTIRHRFLDFPGEQKFDGAIDELIGAAENARGRGRGRGNTENEDRRPGSKRVPVQFPRVPGPG